MLLKYVLRALFTLLASVVLVACQKPDLSNLRQAPASLVDLAKLTNPVKNFSMAREDISDPASLKDILDGSLARKNKGSDFLTILKYALNNDPNVISAQRDIEGKLAFVASNRAQKDFQVATTLYGGIEDVTDNTKGLAASVNASRLVFDGGKLDSQINSAVLDAQSAKLNLLSAIDMRAYELCVIWLELEEYRTLQKQIEKRLAVLDPLIAQLERVAEAGIGDVTKVTAAQRTVSSIRVEQTSIKEGLAQAELHFVNAFGPLSEKITFDYDFISTILPEKVDDSLVQSSPKLLAEYASYEAAVASVNGLKAKRGFNIGFEIRAMRPFAGSGYDSDESVGLVGRKTLFNGGLLESQIKEAEALVEARAAKIQATYRKGEKSVQAAKQNIDSMDKAILIVRENAKLTSDEIVYLRQQLIIGGSTLDDVLSAEARLYEAESREIKLLTEKYKSQLAIATSLGLLSKSLGF